MGLTDSLPLTALVWAAVAVAGSVFYFLVIHRVVKHYVHYPVPAILEVFIDNPIRRAFQPPKTVVDWTDIREGMSVLEIGPGPGTFTIEAAQRVGRDGRLTTMDIQASVISKLDRRLRREGYTNVDTRVAPAHELPFADGTFDRVFMVAVLGEIPDKHRALLEIRRVLKDAGLLAIGELLPDPDYPRQRTVIKWCSAAGLQPVSAHHGLIHYVLNFRKSPAVAREPGLL